MQKTFCDRCGREIPAGEVVLVQYTNRCSPCKSIADSWTSTSQSECLHLCHDCARDFNAFMEEMPLREEENAKEPTGSP